MEWRLRAAVLGAILTHPWNCWAGDVQGFIRHWDSFATLAAFAACAGWEGRMHLVAHINHIHINTVGTRHKTETDSKKIDFLSLTPLSFCSFLVFVQLTVPPHSTTQLPVRFCPSALGRRNHKATITFKCPKVG